MRLASQRGGATQPIQFQSRRSGFGVCVLAEFDRQLAQQFQSRRSGFGVCVRGFPPWAIAQLTFQSRRSGFGVCVVLAGKSAGDEVKFQSRRSGFGVCVDLRRINEQLSRLKFQSRRSGFGVCVCGVTERFTPTKRVSVPAIGIWGLRRVQPLPRPGADPVSVPAIGIWGLRPLL